MRITVLWEDSHAVKTKGFGPHELLVAFVAAKLERGWREVGSQISSLPEKGAGNVIKVLKVNLPKLTKLGPVFAVMDRDKAREIWKPASLPTDCMSAIQERIASEIPSRNYDLVFLVDNMESLVAACDSVTPSKLGGRKPTPDERDRILNKAAWENPPGLKNSILEKCPSFMRLVDRVGNALSLRL